ncbi:MAG: hypothetical protein V3G41_04440 [Lachnospiraceae bacterium]
MSRGIIDDNTVCDEPAKFIADNPIIQDCCDFHNEILDLLKTFKKENELFTDRLSEIGENYRAMNDTATQRISADKVEHNAMPVSTKVQAGSSLNAPVSTMPKLDSKFRVSYKTGDAKVDEEIGIYIYPAGSCHYLYMDYLTENEAVNNEIEALFDKYGGDLSGLKDLSLSEWDNFSEEVKCAIACVYTVDMNNAV